MLSVYYKFRLLVYVLRSVKELLFNFVFLLIYIYCSGVVLVFLSQGVSSVLISPIPVFKYLYNYLIDLYVNFSDVRYGIIVRTLIAFILPYFLLKQIGNIRWKKVILYFIKGGVQFAQKKVNKSSASQDMASRQVEYLQEEAQMIKSVIMSDVEKLIDSKLAEIFKNRQDLKKD